MAVYLTGKTRRGEAEKTLLIGSKIKSGRLAEYRFQCGFQRHDIKQNEQKKRCTYVVPVKTKPSQTPRLQGF